MYSESHHQQGIESGVQAVCNLITGSSNLITGYKQYSTETLRLIKADWRDITTGLRTPQRLLQHSPYRPDWSRNTDVWMLQFVSSLAFSLLTAYDQCASEAEKEKLLSSIRYGKLKRFAECSLKSWFRCSDYQEFKFSMLISSVALKWISVCI